MMVYNFFSEPGTVNFTINSKDEYEKDHIKGGPLTTEFHTYPYSWKKMIESQAHIRAKFDQLIEEENYYGFEASSLLKRIDSATTDDEQRLLWNEFSELQRLGKHLTPEAQAVSDEVSRSRQMWHDKQLQYAKEHTSIVGYDIIMGEIEAGRRNITIDIALITELFNTIYAPKFPNHPYTERMRLLMNNAVSAGVGSRFIDFEAPDLDGNMVRLSDQIQGKIAVIHFWASWCAPCLRKGQEFAPIYETYKGKGFTVVGVARERNNTNAMKSAIERHKYPWLNLVELHDNANIWVKYGLGNSGGGDFLVDENGMILAINPTAEEVETILKEL
jgi:peroxiredoxin